MSAVHIVVWGVLCTINNNHNNHNNNRVATKYKIKTEKKMFGGGGLLKGTKKKENSFLYSSPNMQVSAQMRRAFVVGARSSSFLSVATCTQSSNALRTATRAFSSSSMVQLKLIDKIFSKLDTKDEVFRPGIPEEPGALYQVDPPFITTTNP